jgi:endonuclease I
VRKKLFKVWNAEDPVSEEECMRYKAIKEVQGNENVVLSEVCK